MPGEELKEQVPMTENVFENISASYYDLTAAEKKAADFVLSQRESCQYLSIAEMAEESGVAEATVSRFCRRLGYKGYNAFKIAIANTAYGPHPDQDILSGPVEADDSIEEMCQKLYSADQDAMRQTLDLMDPETLSRAVDLLRKAKRVFCMGQGGSMLIARETHHVFSTVSGKFTAVEDSHSQMVAASGMGRDDVILFFSYSGSTRDMMDVLHLAKDMGARVILVTRFPKSPGASYADLVLQCGSNEGPLQMGSVPAKIAQLFLVDMIFSEFCRRDLDACRASRERVNAALGVKHL